MSAYPIVLQLEGRPCLVVGGGAVAERKARELLAAGAAVTVVAPQLSPGLCELAREKAIASKRRRYRRGDVGGFFLAIAATDSSEANRRIHREAVRRRVLINAVDDPERSSFLMPALVRRGRLLVAVSTSGAVPYFARELRRFLEARLYPQIGEDLERLERLRAAVLEEAGADRVRRQERLAEVLQPEVDRILKKVGEQ